MNIQVFRLDRWNKFLILGQRILVYSGFHFYRLHSSDILLNRNENKPSFVIIILWQTNIIYKMVLFLNRRQENSTCTTRDCSSDYCRNRKKVKRSKPISYPCTNHRAGRPYIYSQTCIKRSPLEQTKKGVFQEMWPLKRGSIHMKFSMVGQEKGDLLIQVTA